MADTEEISLRPMSLRPGGGAANPFAGFGKGAGFGIRRAPVGAPAPEEPRKLSSEIIKYTPDFLLKFMDRYTKAPIELQQASSEIVLQEDTPDRDEQRLRLQKVVEEVVEDGRDWRTRTPLPPSQERAGQKQDDRPLPQRQNNSTPVADLPKLQKASELGRQAYKPGAASKEGTERAQKVIKGVLNKLTPEKFERLLAQLLEAIITSDLLQFTISLVFESAVAQPTFVALYAELCLRLSKELPEFPPPEGDDKPITFRRMLLNICQDEFESVSAAREQLKTITEKDERDIAERKVKMRTLGNVRLISELFKKGVVTEKIMHFCIMDLIKTPSPKDLPPEESIESVCEMITLAGKALSEAKGADKLDVYLARLQRIGEAKELASRIKFLIKDVLDLKRSKWVPRREVFTAKKLDEVRAEAEAELGMVITSRITAALPALPVQQAAAKDDMMDLLPPLRGGEDGWVEVGKKGPKLADKQSALLGDYIAPAPRGGPAATSGAAPSAAPAPQRVVKVLKLSEEERTTRCKGLFREFAGVGDRNEALLTAKEISASEHAQLVVETGLGELLEATKERDQEKMIELILILQEEGQLSTEALALGLGSLAGGLGDLSIDVPLAPKLLGTFLGKAATRNMLGLELLPEICTNCEFAQPRREFFAAVLKVLQAAAGDDAMATMCTEAGLKASELLKTDPEIDGDDAPSAEEFLKSVGLQAVPL